MIWWPNEYPTLQYGLITLRGVQEKDIHGIYEGCKDPLIPRFTRISPEYTFEDAENFVNKRVASGFSLQAELQLALEYDEEFAGVFSFHTIHHEDHRAEIGYWLVPAVRGKKVATTGVKVLTQYGFDTMGFKRIEAMVNAPNIASQRVLMNAGYDHEGTLRDRKVASDGSAEDMLLYAALSRDWSNQ